MSRENVEIVRRAHEALNAGNIDELVTLCHRFGCGSTVNPDRALEAAGLRE
jgi:hypothetical protein